MALEAERPVGRDRASSATCSPSWARSAAWTYLRKLSQQNIKMVNASARAILDQVIAGEYAMALQIFNHHAAISAEKGAPVDWVRLSPVTVTPDLVGLPKNSPHPNAGLLFVEFMTSKEGQQIFQKANYLPARPDVPPLTPNLIPEKGGFTGDGDHAGDDGEVARPLGQGGGGVVQVSCFVGWVCFALPILQSELLIQRRLPLSPREGGDPEPLAPTLEFGAPGSPPTGRRRRVFRPLARGRAEAWLDLSRQALLQRWRGRDRFAKRTPTREDMHRALDDSERNQHQLPARRREGPGGGAAARDGRHAR